MKLLSTVALFFLFANPAFAADTLPPEVLDREFDNCMKQPSNGMERQKTAYCACMRSKMTSWTEEIYMRIAQEVAQSGTNSPTLEALAADCIKRTFH